MQEDALHVLVVVGVAMAMIVVSVVVAVPMVCMAKGCKTHNVDEEAQDTDNQKFIQSLQLVTFPQALESIEYDLQTDKSK